MTNDHRHYPDPDRVIAFLDELRNAGYHIGVAQYIAAQNLLVALVTHSEVEETEVSERFKRMLGPLVCTSPEEQEDFQRRYATWFATSPSPAQAAQPTPPSPFEQQLVEEEQAMRRLPRLKIAAVAIGVLLVVLVLLGVKYGSPGAISGYFSPSPVPTGVTVTIPVTPTSTPTLQPTTETAVANNQTATAVAANQTAEPTTATAVATDQTAEPTTITPTQTPILEPSIGTTPGGIAGTPPPTATPPGAGDGNSAGIPMTWFWIGLF